MSKKGKKNGNSRRNLKFLKDVESYRYQYKNITDFKQNVISTNRTTRSKLNQLRKTNNFGRR